MDRKGPNVAICTGCDGGFQSTEELVRVSWVWGFESPGMALGVNRGDVCASCLADLRYMVWSGRVLNLTVALPLDIV